jgi:hypothetical protein
MEGASASESNRSKFPVPPDEFLVCAKKILCSVRAGNRTQRTEIAARVDARARPNGRKYANSLLFSLQAGNSRIKADHVSTRDRRG